MTNKNASPFSANEWRAINIAAQGLVDAPKDVTDCIARLGYVQIDSIQVAARAHDHVLHSRLADFRPEALAGAIADKSIFEYWSHAAAYLPMGDYRFSLPRKLALRNGERHWFERDSKEMREVLSRIRAEGPLKASDFEAPPGRAGAWWDWKPAKKALEQLFMEGDLMVARREGFQKVYDLTERVLPADVDNRVPSDDEYGRYLVQGFLDAHGHGSLAEICYLRRNVQPLVKKVIADMLEDGELESFVSDGRPRYYRHHIAPVQLPSRVWLLNPFDNLLIQRNRLKQWFDFDYQIEVYVPEPKRRFGYYSLGILWRDTFVGRVDVKADREKGLLRLRRLTLEDAAYDKAGSLQPFLAPMEQALAEFCRFNGLARWKLEAASDKQLKRHYARQVWI